MSKKITRFDLINSTLIQKQTDTNECLIDTLNQCLTDV